MATRYFVSSRTEALLRRDAEGDWVFVEGKWKQPTDTILNYMVGSDDDVEEVTAAKAKDQYPGAF